MNKFFEFLSVYGLAILIILVAIVVLIVFNQPAEKDFCDENQEECVCAKTVFCSYKSGECNNKNIFEFPDVYEKCIKYRPKTDFEKETEYCNQYPDDKKCYCEEYKTRINQITDRIPVDKIRGDVCCENLVTKKEGKTFVYDNCRYCQENFTYMIEERVCSRARPKTECEKGDPDFYEKSVWKLTKLKFPKAMDVLIPDCNGKPCNEICSQDYLERITTCIEKDEQ